MKKRIIIPILLILILASATFVYSGLNNPNDISINSIIAKLCSKEFNGRLPGTEGNEKTEEYLRKVLETIGLEEYSDNSYKSGFDFDFFNPELQTNSFIIEYDNGKQLIMDYNTDFMEQGIFEELNINYPITFDINNPNIENSIVAIEGADSIRKVYNKAKGILVKKLDFKKYVMLSSGTPIIQISNEAFDKIKSLQNPVGKLEFASPKDKITLNNISGKLAGASTDTAVVLSAHFDHVGSYGKNIYFGASDNASGVAVVLDVAQKLKQNSTEKQLNKNIIIGLFNGEESGLHGSKSFVNQIKKQYKNIININVDFIGAKSGGILIISGERFVSDSLMSDLDSFLKEKKYDCDLGGTNYTSDHLSFTDSHIISLNIGQKESDIIHTTKDTVDSIDLEYLKKLSNDIYSFILSIDSKEYIHDCSNDNKLLTEYLEKIVADEKEKLSIGEYKAIQIEQAFVVVSKDREFFKDFEEFQSMYPSLTLPNSIGEFKIKDVRAIHNFEFPVYSDNLEVNKVYKFDVTFDNLIYLGIPYVTENKLIGFNISVMDSLKQVKYDKQVKVDNIIFDVDYDEANKQIRSFQASKALDDKSINVQINMYDITTETNDGVATEIKTVNWFDNSLEKSVKFMSDNHFGDIVNDILKNFN